MNNKQRAVYLNLQSRELLDNIAPGKSVAIIHNTRYPIRDIDYRHNRLLLDDGFLLLWKSTTELLNKNTEFEL